MHLSEQSRDLKAKFTQHYKRAAASDFAGKVVETYLTRILVMGIGLLSTVIVSRALGPTGRGYYAVAMAIGALGAQFATLGMHTANGYLVAKQPGLLPVLLGNTLAVSLGFGGVVALVLAVVFHARPAWLDLGPLVLALGLLMIPFGLGYLLLQSLMLGLHDVHGYNLVEAGGKIIAILLIVSLAFTRRTSVTAFLGVGLLVMILSNAWILARLRRHFDGWPEFSTACFRESAQYAIKAYLAAFFCFLVLRADLFMVQHMLGPEQAGYYSIAATMADYVSVLAAVVGTILFPKLSALSDLDRKLSLTKKASVGTAVILTPLLALASFAARPAVRLLFGPAFIPASTSFILLMPGMLFLGIHAVSVQFLNSIGYPRSVVFIWGLGSLLNIVINLWAIPHYGIAGASVVSSVSYFLVFFLVGWVILRTGREIRFATT